MWITFIYRKEFGDKLQIIWFFYNSNYLDLKGRRIVKLIDRIGSYFSKKV